MPRRWTPRRRPCPYCGRRPMNPNRTGDPRNDPPPERGTRYIHADPTLHARQLAELRRIVGRPRPGDDELIDGHTFPLP